MRAARRFDPKRPTAGSRTLFRLADDGRTAVRVPVQLGNAAGNRIEVLAEFAENDKVVLSDTSAWDAWDSIRLH